MDSVQFRAFIEPIFGLTQTYWTSDRLVRGKFKVDIIALRSL